MPWASFCVTSMSWTALLTVRVLTKPGLTFSWISRRPTGISDRRHRIAGRDRMRYGIKLEIFGCGNLMIEDGQVSVLVALPNRSLECVRMLRGMENCDLIDAFDTVRCGHEADAFKEEGGSLIVGMVDDPYRPIANLELELASP